MIRSLSFLVAALISVSAHATPKLGDYAAFDATISLSGQQVQALVEQELVQHDASKNEFLERQTITYSGQSPEMTDSWKAANDFVDDATINAVLGNCSAAGGSLQTITVPAGQFNTCAVNVDNDTNTGTVWITMVPFGVAQMHSVRKSDGMVIDLALRNFR